MRILDKILYKRLERIREELNSYIAEKLDRKFEHKRYEKSKSVESPMVYQENLGGTMEKFLQVMPLKENVSEVGFDDEEYNVSDECSDDKESVEESRENKKYDAVSGKQISSPQTHHMYVSPSLKPSHPETTISPSEIRIPDFLCTEERKKSIDEVLENKAETFSTMLLRLIDEKGLKDSEVYKNANIDRRLFSKIRGDEDYVPSKKTAISFCLALQLEMEEAKKLLETAGYALSTASRFDLIIMYLIENKKYNIHFANIVLEDYGEGTLSK